MTRTSAAESDSFAGTGSPEVIFLAVRWYLRYGLPYRDVEELLAERGIGVDHVIIHRGVQRFTPLLIDAARPCRHTADDRWFVVGSRTTMAGSRRDCSHHELGVEADHEHLNRSMATLSWWHPGSGATTTPDAAAWC